MTVDQAIEALHAYPRMGQGGATLDRMVALLAALGNPEKDLKFIHIAGTNGKGTVAALTSSILQQAGYKTGLTISPYVLEFRERFQINGEMIPKRVLAKLTETVLAAAESLPQQPCQFEVVTALALLWFAQEKCDLVVLETGLGGRLDATNAVQNTLVAAITRIGLDHTELLGDTLDKIAVEKAGILKEGCTVVCYPEQPKAALTELLAASAAKHCKWIKPDGEDMTTLKGRVMENRINYGGYEVKLPFPGRHQGMNAAMAVEICLALDGMGYSISDEAILKGLETAFLPARQEVLSRHPLVILDGCHNPDGVAALAESLAPLAEDGRIVAVMGVLADKNVDNMLTDLENVFDKVYTVRPDSPRALTAEQLAEKAKFHFDVEACDSLSVALKAALRESCDAVVVCGSLYLAAQARPILKKMLG